MYGARHQGQYPAYEPGIEVVQAEYHPDAAVPQVSPDPSQNDKYALETNIQEQGEGTHWFKNEGQRSYAHPADTPRSAWKRKRWIALAVGAIIAIIVAATVGGVVGTRSRQRADGAQDEHPERTSTEPPPDSPRAMTGSPTSVAPGLAPTAVSLNSSQLEVWALTKDMTNSIYRKWLNDSSPRGVEPQGTGMELVGDIPIDANKAPSIAVVKRFSKRWTDNYRVDVHVTSIREPGAFFTWHFADQIIRPSYPKTPWGKWTASSQLSSAQALVVWGNEVEKITSVFLKDNPSAGVSVWYAHAEEETKFKNVQYLPGPDLHAWATPAALAWDPTSSRVDIFAVSTDNHLQHAILEDPQNSRWSEYEDLGGFVTTPPTVVSRAPGSLDVFARGGDGGLWHLSFERDEKTWSSWRCISGNTSIQGQPHAISASRDSIDVFAWGDGDGAMLYKTYDPIARKWMPNDDEFIPLGIKGLVGPPKAVVFRDEVVVLAYDEANNIVWQTIGSNKTAVGEQRILAKVPAKVS